MQWEPFNTRFGKVSSSFKHHLDILSHLVQARQYNAILDGNRAAEVERQRAQQRDAGMFFFFSLSPFLEVLSWLIGRIIEDTRRDFMNWICTIDFVEEHALTFKKRYKDTGNWLLEKPVFQQWFDVTDSSALWCYGKRNIST